MAILEKMGDFVWEDCFLAHSLNWFYKKIGKWNEQK
jgi:hypothetical protein